MDSFKTIVNKYALDLFEQRNVEAYITTEDEVVDYKRGEKITHFVILIGGASIYLGNTYVCTPDEICSRISDEVDNFSKIGA